MILTVKLVLGVLLLATALVGSGLAANRLPWNDPPGPWQRAVVYLTTNTAETAPDHPFPELRTRAYRQEHLPLFMAIHTALDALDWEIRERDAEEGTVRAVVTTQWLRFRDDVTVRLVPDGDVIKVELRSASRIGRGDLGANTRHVLDFYEQLERVLAMPAAPANP